MTKVKLSRNVVIDGTTYRAGQKVEVDDERKTELAELGVLDTGRKSDTDDSDAKAQVEAAQAEVAKLRKEAEADAEKTRSEAQAEAAKVAEKAGADAKAQVEAAEKQATAIVEKAKQEAADLVSKAKAAK